MSTPEVKLEEYPTEESGGSIMDADELERALNELEQSADGEALVAESIAADAAAALLVPAPALAKKAKPAATKKTSATAKRGPGRPPSKPQAPSLEKKGVVDSPLDPSNRLEMAYEQPGVFKALFAYFKNLRAREIHVRCNPEGITFFARDHSKKSRVIANMVGKHLNWHYCEDEYWFGINKDGVEKIFSTIDKSFCKIAFIQTHESPTWLTIVFKDSTIDKECSYDIVLSSFSPDEELFAAEDILDLEKMPETFPLELTLTAKQFKKTITDASNHSTHATFERIGDRPLVFTYTKANLVYRETYYSDEKIHLRSSIPPGGIFRCMINVARVKSIAASMVTDDVRILCAEVGDILFRSALDEKALVVNTLAPLED
jgi:intracellular sulfur oxidation DsrE/DsrF family protein